MDVGINDLNELLNGFLLPVPRIEQLRFQPPEEALTGRILGRVADPFRFLTVNPCYNLAVLRPAARPYFTVI